MGNSRSRSFDGRTGLVGTYQTFSPAPSITVQSALSGPYGTCDDTVLGYREKRVPNAFLCIRKEEWVPTFSGVYPPAGTPTKQLTGCPADYRPGPPSPSSKFGELSTVQQSSLAWESLAATNPNVAHVSLPSYLAELKDLPSLWRAWGSNALDKAARLWKELEESPAKADKRFVQIASRLSDLKSLRRQYVGRYIRIGQTAAEMRASEELNDLLTFAPKANIWYRWGWAPLVSDIRKMFSFTEAVSQRIKWLSALQSGKRVLKRRASLRNSTDWDPPTTAFAKTVGAFITGRRTVVYTEKVWCTVQWKLSQGTKVSGVGLEGDPLWALANQLTFGISYQDALSALWQIMPWSWLVDWFLHVSTIIDATNNTIPLTWGDICLMRETTARAEIKLDDNAPDLSWCKPTGRYKQSEVRKRRLLVSPILPFAPSMMPVFTSGQLSILGSLAVLRAAGSHLPSKVR